MNGPGPRFAALILAGGESRRMGRPKALLPLGGRTFVDRLILAFAPSCDPVVVVLGHDAAAIRAGIAESTRARFAVNTDYRLGQLSSLQCGLRAIGDSAPGVFFTPVDYPAIRPETVAALAGSFDPGRHPVIAPSYRGRHGHPVGVGPQAVAGLLALDPAGQARDVLRGYRDRTLYIEVDDPGVIRDVDDPETYQSMVEAMGS